MPSAKSPGYKAMVLTALAAAAVASGANQMLEGVTGVQTVRYVNVVPNLTGTGADATQITYSKYANTNLIASGGVVTYDTLSWSNPDTITGALLTFCIDVKTAPAPATTVDVGVVRDDGTGSGETLFNNLSLTRGVHCADVSDTTEVLVGPDERIKAAGTSGTGAGLDAEMFLEYREARL